MDALTQPFEALYQEYFKIADKIVQSSITNLIEALVPVITVGLALYVMITGYMVVAGRIQDPISDVLIKLSKWTIIAFIALNAGTITSYLIGGFNGIEQTIIKGFSSNSDNVFATLDKTLQNGLMAAAEAQGENTGYEVLGVQTDIPDPAAFLRGLVVSVVIAFAVIIQTFAAGTIIMLAKISLLVVFALAPLMLSGLFFPQTAKFADGWFNQCFNYVLTGVIAAFFASIGSSLFETTVTAAKEAIMQDELPVIELAVMTLIACFNYFAIKQSPSIAAGLAGGVASGTASLMGAARTLAGAGSGIGLAANLAKSTGKKTYQGLYATAHPVQAVKHTARRAALAIQRINRQVVGSGGNKGGGSVEKN